MADVHRRWGHEPLQLNAQAHLEAWYESFGYRRTGENFDDAGIDHVPMAREPHEKK
jgi:ElaA protein